MRLALRRSRDTALNRSLFARGLPGCPWVGDHHAFWVLWRGDEPVGFCSAVLIPRDATVFLSSAAVFRDARGHGAQRMMIRRRLAWSKRQGASDVVTYTVVNNWESAVSLLRCGFRTYDPKYPWVGRAWYWHRSLS